MYIWHINFYLSIVLGILSLVTFVVFIAVGHSSAAFIMVFIFGLSLCTGYISHLALQDDQS